MPMMFKIAALGAALAVFSSPALAADECLFKGSINGWTVSDDQHLTVTSGASRKYDIELLGHCTGLGFTETLAFDTRPSAMCVEPGDRIVFSRGGAGQQSCAISKITPHPQDAD